MDFDNTTHGCRQGCGACCIAPSISSPIPGMPHGKPSGTQCIHLTEDMLCGIYNSPLRPAVCSNFSFDPLVCGRDKLEAIEIFTKLETST